MGRVAIFFRTVATMVASGADAWKSSVAETERERIVKALQAASPSAEWITITVGEREMHRRVAEGWEVVVHNRAGEYDFGDNFLMRRRRDDLKKSMNL